MKKKKIIVKAFMILAAVFCFAACQPDDPEEILLDQFVGEYDLHASVIEAYADGQSSEPGGEWDGTLTITLTEDESVVDVTSSLNMSGTQVNLYHTLGSLDEENRLVLAPSTFINPSTQAVNNISYGTIALTDPLSFSTELTAQLSGYDLKYVIHNTARLKQ